MQPTVGYLIVVHSDLADFSLGCVCVTAVFSPSVLTVPTQWERSSGEFVSRPIQIWNSRRIGCFAASLFRSLVGEKRVSRLSPPTCSSLTTTHVSLRKWLSLYFLLAACESHTFEESIARCQLVIQHSNRVLWIGF